jgi:hypothetical protein
MCINMLDTWTDCHLHVYCNFEMGLDEVIAEIIMIYVCLLLYLPGRVLVE